MVLLQATAAAPRFDSNRAWEHLRQFVSFGPRPAGSPAIEQTRQYIKTQLAQLNIPVGEQAWEGEVPSGARVLGSSREVHHINKIQTGTRTATRTVSEQVQTGTERVKTGTRDLGNGYFEDVYEDRPVYETREHEESYQEPVYRDDPVYRQRYRYEIDKWMPDREAKAEGQDRSAAWPDPNLGAKEREGSRTEVYEVLLQDAKGKAARYKAPNEQVWRSFEEGRTYKAKVYSSGEIASIEGMPPPVK